MIKLIGMCNCWFYWVSFKAPVSLSWIPETSWGPDAFQLWFTLFAFLNCSASNGTVTPRTQAAPITGFSAQLDLLDTYCTGQFCTALLHAANVKQVFCTTVCFLMMSRVRPETCRSWRVKHYCDINKIMCIGWFKL